MGGEGAAGAPAREGRWPGPPQGRRVGRLRGGPDARRVRRASLWSSCVVLPLLALTWMSAVLAVTDRRSALFQILFAVFDSLDGFVIVMVHCILRREVGRRGCPPSPGLAAGPGPALPSVLGMSGQPPRGSGEPPPHSRKVLEGGGKLGRGSLLGPDSSERLNLGPALNRDSVNTTASAGGALAPCAGSGRGGACAPAGGAQRWEWLPGQLGLPSGIFWAPPEGLGEGFYRALARPSPGWWHRRRGRAPILGGGSVTHQHQTSLDESPPQGLAEAVSARGCPGGQAGAPLGAGTS